MQVIDTAIADVKIIEPKVFGDARGFFFESFTQKIFDAALGKHYDFVQDNHSKSSRGVLRGLHYQIEQAQGKLVRVVEGRVLDVAVELSADNKRQLWVPPGFAHGFVVFSETAEFLYKTTDYYAPAHERCIAWNDPQLAIDWQLGDIVPKLSAKDQQGKAFAAAEVFA